MSKYGYEVQVEAEGRRRGLGARLMTVLERLARATRMRCVRLTALTHNPAAAAFFKACGRSTKLATRVDRIVLRISQNESSGPGIFLQTLATYSKDETSPSKEEAAHYEILSKSSEAQTEQSQSEPDAGITEGLQSVDVAK
ncbi:N-alpha-acetyltransferase 40 [Eumeta japonica]|uniref:N-alpha-acetyltransferase 40 n=1 Tax=Eumeta variegata TaxID=151549 RepID=A0A4C1XCM8_EUMVA|nr:N-alpha-acetyltransferase 40 [Eumeta japonica]